MGHFHIKFPADKMLLGIHLALFLLLGCSTTFAANIESIQVDGYGEVWAIAPDTAEPGPIANPDPYCPGGTLDGCIRDCPEEPPERHELCVNECIAMCS